MDRFDFGDFGKRVSRALRTPRQIRAEQDASWERRKARLPDYHTRELLVDSRRPFTPADELSKMDGFLARHGSLATQWRSRYPRMVIDVRAAKRELETKIRAEGLGFFEKIQVRRNFRATLSLLQIQGAKRSYVDGTLKLNWRQKALYRFGELKPHGTVARDFLATGETVALMHEAERQTARNAVIFHYEPGIDPRLGIRTELKRLQKFGLAKMESPGFWILDKRQLVAKIREYRPPLLSAATIYQLREVQVGEVVIPAIENGCEEIPIQILNSAETKTQTFTDKPNQNRSKSEDGARRLRRETGFKPMYRVNDPIQKALNELEAYYPKAVRSTANDYEINLSQLRKALYLDRMQFMELWAYEHRDPLIARSDHRLAQALAVSINYGDQAIYHPSKDYSGKTAQNVRYLKGFAMLEDQSVVCMGRGNSFLIDRPAAVALINQQRQALLDYEQRIDTPLAKPTSNILNAFIHNGKVQQDGSWRLDLSSSPVKPSMVWRLHQITAFNPSIIKQMPDGSYHLSYKAARANKFPGTPEWAIRINDQYKWLYKRERDPSRSNFLSVSLQDNQAPLTCNLSSNTQATYTRVARRQFQIPLEEYPKYLVQRAEELSRSAWWLEHAVMRRDLYALELSAKKDSMRKIYKEIRTGIELMDYEVLRQQPQITSPNPAQQAISPQTVKELKAAILARGDKELHDAITIMEATGLRPGELAHGVRLEQQGKAVCVHIQGGKRASGVADAEARFQAERGADRVVIVKSEEMRELAQRHNGYFCPESSPDALRNRLRDVRNEVPDGQNIRFYSFRHALKNKLELEGHSRKDIARIMGHRSLRSQASYWVQ